jgi:hypothetical protein
VVREPEVRDGRDLTIVNPRHLNPSLQGAVCEQCHLLGDQRVSRLGRTPFDYRPGLPTIAFFADYGAATVSGRKAVGHVDQMKVSRCFSASQGQLGCISCHDPHKVPEPEARVSYFRDRCLACHERTGCALPAEARLAKSPDDSCIECHMPRSTSIDVVHVASTDHRIVRSPAGSRSEPDGQPGGLPFLLKNGENLRNAERVALSRELAIALALEGPRLPRTPRIEEVAAFALAGLDKAVAADPGDSLARRMKAQVLALSGHRRDAIPQIEAVLRATPHDEKALEQYLAYAIDEGETGPALEPARSAVVLNPWSASFRERLAYIAGQHTQWDESLREARAALRLDPFLRFARMFLIEALLHEKHDQTAADEFATLIKIHSSQRTSLETWFAEAKRNAQTRRARGDGDEKKSR